MSASSTIRNAFIFALTMGSVVAPGAHASENEYQWCWSTLLAGGPYEGRFSNNVRGGMENRQASIDRIKKLKEEKVQFETLQVFLGDSPHNQKTMLDLIHNIDKEIQLEVEDQVLMLKGMEESAKRECESIRKRLPPPVVTTPHMQPPPRAAADTTAALEMSAWPQAGAPYAPWTTVAPGQIEQHTAGYAGTYTWSTPPYHIGPEGFDLTLTAQAQCAQGQRLSTGINLRGGFDFVKSAYDNTNVSTDLAAYCEGNGDQKSLTVHVKPSKTYNAGQDVVITIGAFYGPSVTYHYTPVRTGN